MKGLIIIASVLIAMSVARPRVRRAAYDLPAGAEEIVGEITRTFSCEGLKYGYYADVDNDCKLYHLCHPQELPGGRVHMGHYTFLCSNTTVFNQLTMSCASPEIAIPCESAKEFYYINDKLGDAEAQFLSDEDIQRGNKVIDQYLGIG